VLVGTALAPEARTASDNAWQEPSSALVLHMPQAHMVGSQERKSNSGWGSHWSRMGRQVDNRPSVGNRVPKNRLPKDIQVPRDRRQHSDIRLADRRQLADSPDLDMKDRRPVHTTERSRAVPGTGAM